MTAINIIDCHAHFEPAILDVSDVISRMDRHGIQKTALMSKVTTKPIYKKSEFLMGIQRFLLNNKVLRPIAKKLDDSFHKQNGEWNPWYRKFLGKSTSYEILHHPDNQSVFDAVAQYPDRLLGWIFLNPKIPDWEQEFVRWKDAQGAIGIKIHPFWHRYSLKDAHPIALLAQEYKLPLMIHMGFDSLDTINEFISEFVNLKLIFSHAAFPYYGDIWKIIKNNPQHYVDLSSHHVSASILREVTGNLGANRCLYGTDDPYGDERAGIMIQSWIQKIGLSHEEQKLIFSINFLKVINQ
jgi:uncharacterized protein